MGKTLSAQEDKVAQQWASELKAQLDLGSSIQEVLRSFEGISSEESDSEEVSMEESDKEVKVASKEVVAKPSMPDNEMMEDTAISEEESTKRKEKKKKK